MLSGLGKWTRSIKAIRHGKQELELPNCAPLIERFHHGCPECLKLGCSIPAPCITAFGGVLCTTRPDTVLHDRVLQQDGPRQLWGTFIQV